MKREAVEQKQCVLQRSTADSNPTELEALMQEEDKVPLKSSTSFDSIHKPVSGSHLNT